MRNYKTGKSVVAEEVGKARHAFHIAVVLLVLAASAFPACLLAQVYEVSVGQEGEVIVSYFTRDDYELLEQRTIYSAGQRVPNSMNSAAVNPKTGTAVIISWFGDRDADCRSFRGDLYYKNRSGPIKPKPGTVDPEIPNWLQFVPVESYAGTYCKGDVVDLGNTVRTVNETWAPGGES